MADEKVESTTVMPPPAVQGDDESSSNQKALTKEEKLRIEKDQEKQLIAKYPQARPQVPGGGSGGGGAGGGGHSAFLQKRLAKGQKYFDSGDYQMAKQKPRGGPLGRMAIPVLAQPPTGDTIPTPDTVPARKTSIIQPLHDHSQPLHLASDPAHVPAALGVSLPTPPAPGQPLPNPAITKLAS